jgi:prophage antirepressor-like protein
VATLLEPGLYYLIGRSNSSVAEPFQDWLYEDVLPSIRRTGKYELAQTPSPSPAPILPTPTLEQISDLIDLTLGKAGLDPKLVAGVKLNAVAKHYPTLAQTAEEAKSLLAIPLESQLLTPKQLGEIIQERAGSESIKN